MENNNIQYEDVESQPNCKLVEISFHEKYNVFDVQLMNLEFLSQYDFVELDISFFPLSRNVTSENYEFEPFEHYIDESKSNKSMYTTQQDLWQHLSGFTTAGLLTGIVAEFNPNNITETESLVALVASYFAGMKAWPNIEAALINKSSKWKLQFKERYYQYSQNMASTGEKYDNFAKKERYKMENIRPDKIGIVIDSIRQKMRLRFTKKQLLALPEDTKKANVMNISIPESLQDEFFKRGVQIGVHIKLGEKVKSYLPFIKTRTELIQTLVCKGGADVKPEIGCIFKENDGFKPGFSEHRDTVAIDRIKYYKEFTTEEMNIIEYKYRKYIPSTSIQDASIESTEEK